ncbi:MAG: calcium-binding protein [Rhizorhabdus sp.]
MKKTPWIAGAALAAVIGTGAFAVAPDGPRHAPKTRAEVQAKVAEHFKKADANGDGYVTKAESDAAREAMKAKFAERREERRDERFAALDADKNGALSKEEFSARPPRPEGKDGERRFGQRGGHGGKHGMHHRGGMGGFGGGQWFERADANKDGKVSLAEASAGALAMFDRADANKDGTISPEEHKAARDAMRAKWQERRSAKAG